jgi:Zn-dependent protease with chaperone function
LERLATYELNYKELEAIIAHELGHIINRDVAIMTWAATYSYLTFVLTYPLSRYREFKADETGCQITGEPQYLISALEKLSMYTKNNRIRDMVFGTHPPTQDRIES